MCSICKCQFTTLAFALWLKSSSILLFPKAFYIHFGSLQTVVYVILWRTIISQSPGKREKKHVIARCLPKPRDRQAQNTTLEFVSKNVEQNNFRRSQWWNLIKSRSKKKWQSQWKMKITLRVSRNKVSTQAKRKTLLLEEKQFWGLHFIVAKRKVCTHTQTEPIIFSL